MPPTTTILFVCSCVCACVLLLLPHSSALDDEFEKVQDEFLKRYAQFFQREHRMEISSMGFAALTSIIFLVLLLANASSTAWLIVWWILLGLGLPFALYALRKVLESHNHHLQEELKEEERQAALNARTSGVVRNWLKKKKVAPAALTAAEPEEKAEGA